MTDHLRFEDHAKVSAVPSSMGGRHLVCQVACLEASLSYALSTMAGLWPRLRDTSSYAWATCNGRTSSNGRPMSWTPMGRPARVNPELKAAPSP
jgi:hypothetical protein